MKYIRRYEIKGWRLEQKSKRVFFVFSKFVLMIG